MAPMAKSMIEGANTPCPCTEWFAARFTDGTVYTDIYSLFYFFYENVQLNAAPYEKRNIKRDKHSYIKRLVRIHFEIFVQDEISTGPTNL